MAVQSPLRKVFRSVFSNTFNLTVNFLSRIGGGSFVTYLSRLMTSSTTTPYYSGTTNIVDTSSTGDYREIQPGRCLDFDGATQYVETTGDTPAFTLPVTFSFWISAATGGDYGVCYTHGTNSNYYGVWAYINTSRYPAFHFGDGRSPGSSTRRTAVSSIALGANQWHYVVGIIRGVEDVDIYIDGVKDQSVTYSGTGGALALTSASFRVGNNNLDTAPLEGKLFDVRFYDDELTAAEITAIYRQGLQPDSIVEGQPDATNLVGRWLLDDNSETTSYDSSGNGNHGTIAGYASGMLYEGSDVPYSAQNLVGHSERINLMPSTYLFDLSDWSGISATNGTYEEITLSNGQPGFRISTNLSRYYRTQQQSIDAGDYTLKMYCENIDPSLTRPMAQAIGSSVYGSILPGDFVNGWAEKTFTHTGGTLNMRCGLGCNANETGSGSADFTYVTLEAGDTTGQLTPQQCQPGSGFVSSGGIAPRDESDPANDVLGNPLQYTGTVPKYATPVDGPCLTFNGSTQSILINNQCYWEDWDTDKYFECYFRVATLKGQQGLLGCAGGYNDRNIGLDADNKPNYCFANGTVNGVSLTDAVETGRDYKITWSWDSALQTATFSLFDLSNNGVLVESKTTSHTGMSENLGVKTHIGCRRTSEPATYFDGLIWNVKVQSSGPTNGDGNIWLPMSEGDGNTVYDVVNGNSYTITGYASTMWTTATQDEFFYSFENGCRVDSGVAIPALADGSAAADGTPLTGLPGLLNSDTYDLNLLPEPDAPYQRSAIPGATFDGVGDYVNAFGIPNSPSGNSVTDDPFSGRLIFKVNYSQNQQLISNGNRSSPGTGDRGIAWLLQQQSTGEIRLRLYDDTGGKSIWWDTPIQSDGEWITVDFEYDGVGGAAISVNNVDQVLTPGSLDVYVAMHSCNQICVASSLIGDSVYFGTSNTTIAYVRLDGFFEYDFRENNGLVIPDRSGNGNDGTLVVNSSLSQIFAPTPFETAYTLGDGRTRPHYVTIDGPNEKDFRTEII
jgi:hypothetical protein